MRVVIDDKLIERRAQVAQRALVVGAVLLAIALVASFTPRYVLPAYAVVILGTVVTTWAARTGSKWLGDLRGDRVLAKVLKGLDNRCRLYSYLLPAEHVLLSPTGLFALRLQRQEGRISCRGEKWHRPFSLSRVVNLLSEERLGDPSKRARREAADLSKFVADGLPGVDVPIQPLIVFINPKAELDVAEPAMPAMPIGALKRYLRSAAKDVGISKEIYRALVELFDEQAT